VTTPLPILGATVDADGAATSGRAGRSMGDATLADATLVIAAVEVRQRRGRGRDLHSSRVGFGVLCLRRAARRNCSPYCLTIAAGDWLAVHCYDGGHGHDHVTW
jgi:hypothetical protein